MIFCWHHRRQKLHKLSFNRVYYTPTGDSKIDIPALTALFNDRLESAIRTVLEQWAGFIRDGARFLSDNRHEGVMIRVLQSAGAAADGARRAR